MKAQMFVVTTIFLTGLIFVVQQILIQYTAVDSSLPFERNDMVLLNTIKDMIGQTIVSGPDCSETESSLVELDYFLKRRALISGYTLSLTYNGVSEANLDCSSWGTGTVLELDVLIRSADTETSGTFTF